MKERYEILFRIFTIRKLINTIVLILIVNLFGCKGCCSMDCGIYDQNHIKSLYDKTVTWVPVYFGINDTNKTDKIGLIGLDSFKLDKYPKDRSNTCGDVFPCYYPSGFNIYFHKTNDTIIRSSPGLDFNKNNQIQIRTQPLSYIVKDKVVKFVRDSLVVKQVLGDFYFLMSKEWINSKLSDNNKIWELELTLANRKYLLRCNGL